MWEKARNILIHRVLGVDDSPHRIALGVAAAFFVAWTPTLGFQMVLAITLATVLRANKAVTVPIVWLTNPLTAVPIFYINWLVGHVILPTRNVAGPTAWATLEQIHATAGGSIGMLGHLFDWTFWQAIGALIWGLGVELWVGSCVVGLLLAVTSYFLTRGAVERYRAGRGRDCAADEPPQAGRVLADAEVNDQRESA